MCISDQSVISEYVIIIWKVLLRYPYWNWTRSTNASKKWTCTCYNCRKSWEDINIVLHIFMSDIWKWQQHAVAQEWKSDRWTERNCWSLIYIHCLSSLDFINVQLFVNVNVVPVICLKFELMWSLWCHVLGVYIKVAHVKRKRLHVLEAFCSLLDLFSKLCFGIGCFSKFFSYPSFFPLFFSRLWD